MTSETPGTAAAETRATDWVDSLGRTLRRQRDEARAELAETRAALDRARDTAALLESVAVVPQVLTEDTPEPTRPWTIVYADNAALGASSRGRDTWLVALALCVPDGRPVYVITGGDR